MPVSSAHEKRHERPSMPFISDERWISSWIREKLLKKPVNGNLKPLLVLVGAGQYLSLHADYHVRPNIGYLAEPFGELGRSGNLH